MALISDMIQAEGQRKQENIVAEAKMRLGRKQMFLENFKSIFLLSTRRFCVKMRMSLINDLLTRLLGPY